MGAQSGGGARRGRGYLGQGGAAESGDQPPAPCLGEGPGTGPEKASSALCVPNTADKYLPHSPARE